MLGRRGSSELLAMERAFLVCLHQRLVASPPTHLILIQLRKSSASCISRYDLDMEHDATVL